MLYICDREGLRIMRYNLHRSDLEALVQTGEFKNATEVRDQTRWCVGITISHRTGLFYWTQKDASKSETGRIFYVPVEGVGLRGPTLLLGNLRIAFTYGDTSVASITSRSMIETVQICLVDSL